MNLSIIIKFFDDRNTLEIRESIRRRSLIPVKQPFFLRRSEANKAFQSNEPQEGFGPSGEGQSPLSSLILSEAQAELKTSVPFAVLPVRTGISKRALPFGRLNEGSPEGGEIRNLPPLAGSFPAFLPEQESGPPEA